MTQEEAAQAVLELAAYQCEIDSSVASPLRYRRMEKYRALQAAMYARLGWELDIRSEDIVWCSDATIRRLVDEAFSRAEPSGIIGQPKAHSSLTRGKPEV